MARKHGGEAQQRRARQLGGEVEVAVGVGQLRGVAKQREVGEVPQLARVTELEVADRPVLAGALDLEPVVDADRPVVAVQVVL